MAKHNEIGHLGESIAENLLLEKGYTILERNWNFRHLEIDLIAKKDPYLAIVEVKTRTSTYAEKMPYEYVDQQKRKNLVVAGNAYIQMKELDLFLRFDIISVLLDNSATKILDIKHLEGAFVPPLQTIN